MAAQIEHVTLLDNHLALGEVGVKVVNHHAEGAHACHNLCLGIALHKGGDAGGVIGLHVMDDQVVGRATVEYSLEVTEPFVDKPAID